MFAFKRRKETEIAIRILLIAAILLNALAINSTPVQAEQETVSINPGQLESRSVPTFPTFERPQERITGRDEQLEYRSIPTFPTFERPEARITGGAEDHPHLSVQMSPSAQTYVSDCTLGLEGLCLAQDYWPWGPVEVDWTVQKSTGGNNKETLFTFTAGTLSYKNNILHNFVASLKYTVTPADVSNNWISFQLGGIQTSAGLSDGTQSAKFYVDIVSPSGLPVTCSTATQAHLTATCIQDSISHVHGMADSGPVGIVGPGFNADGGWARVAVTGLTAGQELIVTFGSTSAINELNTLSSCWLDKCKSSASSATGVTTMPINTRTGNYEYFTEDLSIPTSAGDLSFTRDYVSAITSLSSTLGPGWTHNHDTRLVFSSDPEGLPNKVLFKAHTANRYVFYDDVYTNLYIPEPGLHATLIKNTGTPVTYTLKDSGQEVYTFNEAGKLLTYTDAQGHTWTYSYLPDGKLDQVTAEGGKFLNLDYDPQGRVNLVKDHTNRSVSYAYNASGDLVTFTDVLSQNWTYEYHPTLAHLLTRVAAPGNVTVERQEYYANGKAWKQYDGEDNLIVELTYNLDGTTTIKDALNNVETHTYSDRSVLVTETNGAGGNLGKQYDFNFRPSVITDALSNPPTNLIWSAYGTNLTQIKDALLNTTQIDYGNYNNPTRVVDPRTYETKYFYLDPNFPTLPTRIEYPLSFDGGLTFIGTDYAYYPPASGTSAGKVELVTDALGNKTHYTYTSSGQPDVVITAYQSSSPLITDYDYDNLGRLIKVTDPAGIVTTHEYDNAGRLTKTIQKVHPTITTQNYQNKYNITTRYFYDSRGNQIAAVDTLWTITRTYYDLADHPISVIQNLVINNDPADTEAEVVAAIGTALAQVPGYSSTNPDRNIRTDTQYDDAGNVIATVDPAGFTARTYYDSANRPNLTIQHFVGTGAYDPAHPDENIRTEYYYDANGNVIATRDTLGVITRTYYDELNRPKTVVQNLYITGTTADINAALSSVPAYTSTYPDRNLRTDTYYDASGNAILTVDPKGIKTRTYYDALNRPITVVQNINRTVADAINLPNPPPFGQGATDADIRTDTYYDKAGNAIATVDPRGVVTRTYYDSANRPIATVQNWTGADIYSSTIPARGSGGPDENVRTDIAYDSSGRRDTTTDPLGHITKYQYDVVGQLIQVTNNYVNGGSPQNDQNQRNIVTLYDYDALGRQVKLTDTSGRITLSDYDKLSRVLTTTQNYLQGQVQNYKDTATGNQYNLKTTFAYDARSNQIAVTDTRNVVTRTYYDALGRSVVIVQNLTGSITNPTPPDRGNPVDPLANLRTDTVYLGDGSVDYVLDELGKKNDYGYDALGRLTTVLDPLLNPTNYEYDANSNRTLMTAFKTETEPVSTKYEYDGLNRLKAVIENNREDLLPFQDTKTNVRTAYTYDSGGNRLSIRDGQSFLENRDYRTFFTYDDLGRMKTETDALSHVTTYDYLADYVLKKNRVVLTDANNKVTTSHYDELARLAQIDYPSPDADVTFTYDALGRRLSMTDGLGTTSWNYTNIDQPKLITDPFGTGVSYDYDPLGNRTALSYGSQSYTYQYNNLNQLDAVTGSGLPNPVTYQYDPAGRLKNVTRPNGANTVYNYFDNGWLQNITHSLGASTLASYQYQYYNNGNRSQAIENVQNPQFGSIPAGALASASPQNVARSANPIDMAFNASYNPAPQFAPAAVPGGEETAGSSNLYPSALEQVDFTRLPLSFVANIGQFDKSVKFQTNSLGGSIYFTPSEVILALMDKKIKLKNQEDEPFSSSKDNSKVARIEYKDAEKNPVVEGVDLQPGVANFMVGSDRKNWVAHAPMYGGVVYRNLYPGIDLSYEGAGSSLKSTFTVAAGADPALIQWSYKDAGNVSLDANGNLLITLPAQKTGQTDTTLIEHTPLAWQEQDGQRMDVAVQYAVTNNGEISFVFPQGYDVSLPLIIDPVLTYSTYLGDLGTDVGTAITTDASGNVYVTGYSWCGNFPITGTIPGVTSGSSQVIISKISANGSTLLYSTCVGGSGSDRGLSIALDTQGRIVVAGETDSTDFPIVGGIATYGGTSGICTVDAPCQDYFILALNAAGTAIRYSTYLGGDGREELGGIAVDANGKIIAVGSTTSTNFPTANAYDSTYSTGGTCSSATPCYDVTVTKIDPDQTGTNAILYSTYLGENNRDKGQAMTVDSNGKVYLTGFSESDGYPTRYALQPTRKGNKDLIVTVIDPSLSGDTSLLYSTYLGSSDFESAHAIARDAGGNLYLTGRTGTSKFPLRDPLQYLSHAGMCGSVSCYEAFVTKLNISTNTLVYSTYLGGSQTDEGNGIAVDSYGRAYVTGFTRSTDFPTLNAIQSTKAADGCSVPPCADAFLSVLEPDGQAFAYSTYLGGDQEDIANGIRVDANNNVYVVGETFSTNFPTTPGAYDVINTQTDKRDAFIAKVSPLGAPPAQPYLHLDIPVSTGSDDAEEYDSGTMGLIGQDLDLVYNGSGTQTVGIRFTNINIPYGAVIQNAWIQFTADAVSSDTASLTIRTEAVDNAGTFTTATDNISLRAKTSAAVNWVPGAWNQDDESGPVQRTPNLAPVIQNVVNRPGWSAGNAMAFIITGSGSRIAKSYERDVYGAPYLHIEYSEPTGTPPPPGGTILTFKPDAASGQDTYILSTSATTNYGTSADMGVGENNNATNKYARGLIKFDLSSIPANATITAATLSLWTSSDFSDNDATVRLYRLKVPFVETEATWNKSSASVNWQTAGASGANDRESVDIGSVQILANEPLATEKQIQLTPSKIQELVSGAFTNNGFILVTAAESNDRFDYKTSDTTTTYRRPKLVIEYTVSAPSAPTPTPTATATATATVTATATATPTATPTFTPPPSGPITINYIYDPLNRLTEANYSNNDYYHYAYDAVGNREAQQKSVLGFVTNDTYVYDDANRLTSLNAVNNTWDNNGNLLNDGVNTYTYDSANRLKTLSGQGNSVTYAYNGLGDRLRETMNGNPTTFTMDLNAGLTQALSDGTKTYIYGNGRIAKAAGTGTEYFLGDALGSVRQMTQGSGTLTYAKAYDPYGVVTTTSGASQTAYGYTSEYTSQGLVYLRARMYAPNAGRFLTRDTWVGEYNRPLSLNKWMYTEGNPVNYVDPSGHSLTSETYASELSSNAVASSSSNSIFMIYNSYSCNNYALSGPPCYEWRWVQKEIEVYEFPFGFTRKIITVLQLVPCGSVQIPPQPDPEDPDPTPPVVILPPVDLGPITSPSFPDPNPAVCKAINNQISSVLKQIAQLAAELKKLADDINKAQDDLIKRVLMEELEKLEAELLEKFKELKRLYQLAKGAGCSGWER